MKQQKIYMKAWLDAHGRAKAVDTDEWYLDFANQLLPLVADIRSHVPYGCIYHSFSIVLIDVSA